MEARSSHHFRCGIAIRMTYSECLFVALGIQHAIACAILSSVACPALQYFSTFSNTRHDFRGGGEVTKRKMCVLNYSTTFFSEAFLILRRKERDMTKHVYWSSCKVPVILVQFHWNLNILYRFSKNPQKSKFMKIRLVGAELLYADGRTDRHDEANSRFSQFCNRA